MMLSAGRRPLVMLAKLAVLMAVEVAAPGTLKAQSSLGAHDVKGLWIGMGAGVSSFSSDCSGCLSQKWAGFSGTVSFGWALSPRARVGAYLDGFWGGGSPLSVRMSAVGVTAAIRPLIRSRVFVLGGGGYVRYRMSRGGAGPDTVLVSGFGWRVGAGYDLALRDGWAVVPTVVYDRIGARPATINGAPSGTDVTGTAVRLVLEVDWHWSPIQWRPTRRR